ncbi:MAG: hypothetical protein ABS35_36865 [Kaistia sp. SCN 65-12]|nr:MAG: hypothetical protein ABS35_36865 [Kaistia sp. SCN 65-12]
MSRTFAFATATALGLFALTAGGPASLAATSHGLNCKTGSQATRVMEKGKHVWRCEPSAHHTSMKTNPGMPQGSSAGGTSY